jgi:hypothetical protein
MDMRKYSGEHFVKVDDVKDGPIQGQIAVVKEGRFGKPDLALESGDVLSLNATNNQILMRAYGAEQRRLDRQNDRDVSGHDPVQRRGSAGCFSSAGVAADQKERNQIRQRQAGVRH